MSQRCAKRFIRSARDAWTRSELIDVVACILSGGKSLISSANAGIRRASTLAIDFTAALTTTTVRVLRSSLQRIVTLNRSPALRLMPVEMQMAVREYSAQEIHGFMFADIKHKRFVDAADYYRLFDALTKISEGNNMKLGGRVKWTLADVILEHYKIAGDAHKYLNREDI